MDDAVARARREALKSAEQFRLGAALLDRRRRAVIASGRNKNCNSAGLASIHAEMDAVWKCRHRSSFDSLHLVVVRVLRDGTTMACSKPCPSCAAALARLGIRKVTYSTGDPRRPLATEVAGAAARGLTARTWS